ncbi:MAG: D-glycero-beta-D-manno-heptose-7-phosphate kinase [Candidatus Omnitrophica bacterium]|nr:D-glycero-beta-D-manno-heptose-7-phosphate kinase [Candidatus Omnitrophota bacterium]
MIKLRSILQKFSKKRVLIVGDLILDEYIWGDVGRISPEAPVPVVWANKRSFIPGGAANVANNISAFDAKATIIGVVGEDKNADILLAELKKRNISTQGIFSQPKRHTTVKTRIIAGHQQVVRVDWEHTDSLPAQLNGKICRYINDNINKFDAVIVEDYGKGVINPHVLEEVIYLAKKYNKIVTVDPKEENFIFFCGVTSITPNRKELENAVRNLRIKDTTNKFVMHNDRLLSPKDIDDAAIQVLKYLDLESILVTLGENGMSLFEKGKNPVHIPTVAQEVFDVSGAGDTVIACFTLALACGATKTEAAQLANFSAGIVVSKIGTAVTNRKELAERLK